MLLWHEYKRDLPRRLRLQPVLRALPALAPAPRRRHAPGAQGGREALRRLPGRPDPDLRPAQRRGGLPGRAVRGRARGHRATSTPRRTRSQELLHWVSAHVHTFECIGGCPPIVVCDNLRSGVTRPHRYEPDVNATYSEMAAHYGVAIIPARAYKPRDKAKVEVGRAVGRALDHGPAAQPSTSPAWPRPTSSHRRACSSGSTPGRSRSSRLAPVPVRGPRPPGAAAPARHPLRVRHLAQGQGGHRLPRRGPGRPPLLLGPLPPGRRGRRGPPVGRHGRGLLPSPPGGLSRAQLPARLHHRPRPHARVAPPPRRRGRRRASSLGRAHRARHRHAGRGGHGGTPHPEQGFRSCLGIIRLGEKYGTDRLEAACSRALAVRSYSYRSVESILRDGLDKKPLPRRRTGAHPPEPRQPPRPGVTTNERNSDARQPDHRRPLRPQARRPWPRAWPNKQTRPSTRR